MAILGRFNVCESRRRDEELIFGLENYQIRENSLIQNAWWFVLDATGKAYQIGTGDLTREDLDAIAVRLEPNERWVILREDAPHQIGGVEMHFRCYSNRAVLSREQVLAGAYALIAREEILIVDRFVMMEGVIAISSEELAERL